MIAAAYESEPRLRDAYSRVGCHFLELGAANEALPWFELDAAALRATWFQRLRHAECLALSGDLPGAEARILETYGAEPAAVNGFASIAWRLRDAGVLPSPFKYADKDIALNRLSPGFMLNVAELAFVEATRRPRFRWSSPPTRKPVSEDAYAKSRQTARPR
jgi:hypothetical protein